MQSGAAGGWLVVIAHVVELVCTPKKPGQAAVSDTYLWNAGRQADRQIDRQRTDRQTEKQLNKSTQISAYASRNTSLADSAYKNRKIIHKPCVLQVIARNFLSISTTPDHAWSSSGDDWNEYQQKPLRCHYKRQVVVSFWAVSGFWDFFPMETKSAFR